MHLPEESVGLSLVALLSGDGQYYVCAQKSGMGIVGEGSSLNLRKHFCFLLPALGSPTRALSMLLTSHLCPAPWTTPPTVLAGSCACQP